MREVEWPFKISELKELFEVNLAAQVFWIVLDWSITALMIASSLYFFRGYPLEFAIPVYLLSILVIASRQHALLVIAHDSAHCRISENKFLNDFIGNIFCSFPGLIGVDAYRTHHLNHHRYLNSEKDPDWVRKIYLEEWQFPMSSKTLLQILAAQFYRGGLEWLQLTYLINKMNGAKKRTFQKENLGVSLLWFAATSFFAIRGWAIYFAFYWIIPMLLIMPILQRFRSITEHFSLPRLTQFSSSRLTIANFAEEFFIAPHSVNYHLVHHLFPAIPHYNIKKAHAQLMKDPVYSQFVHINNGFFSAEPDSTWSELTTKRKFVNSQVA